MEQAPANTKATSDTTKYHLPKTDRTWINATELCAHPAVFINRQSRQFQTQISYMFNWNKVEFLFLFWQYRLI